MTDNFIPKTIKDNNCYILYDESVISEPKAELFCPDYLKQQGKITGIDSGRGSAWFVDIDNRQWVLRHYKRGGLISKLIKDTYWSPVLNKTRAWYEWKLLKTLHENNLPVPRPVAAASTSFLGFYKADIIIEKIPDTQTLASILTEKSLTNTIWKNIGDTIKRFHDLSIYHADLNANNILLNKSNKIFIIDFDRGKIRRNGSWKETNLKRLQRSLNKIRNNQQSFMYQDSNWQDLLKGYYQK